MKKIIILLLSITLLSCSKNNTSPSNDSWTGTYKYVSSNSSDTHYAGSFGYDIKITNESSFTIPPSGFNQYIQTQSVTFNISGTSASSQGFQIMDHWTYNGGTCARSGNKITFTYSITVVNPDGTTRANPHYTDIYQK